MSGLDLASHPLLWAIVARTGVQLRQDGKPGSWYADRCPFCGFLGRYGLRVLVQGSHPKRAVWSCLGCGRGGDIDTLDEELA